MAARHPRTAASLERTQAPAAAFAATVERGRLHHAWLLTGPQGLGKASFAYQAARRLLGARPLPGLDPMASPPDDPVSRMVAARSHPDLLVLERAVEDQPPRKSIPVDEARRLPAFFAKSPAVARLRVAIIDSADDLNVNAANAVLKTLEEPSGRGVLLLVSHAPGRLLPTIRSRCRRLAFDPWPEAALADFACNRMALEVEDARRLARMAGGAPGRMLHLADAGALQLDTAAGALFAAEGRLARNEAMRLADGLRGGEGMERLTLLLERLAERLHAAALNAANPAEANRLAALQQRASRLPGLVEALNLDRADAFWSFLAELRATTTPVGAPAC